MIDGCIWFSFDQINITSIYECLKSSGERGFGLPTSQCRRTRKVSNIISQQENKGKYQFQHFLNRTWPDLTRPMTQSGRDRIRVDSHSAMFYDHELNFFLKLNRVD
eukprot:TRINITY_DN9082_c2_g2_i1.p1 TRINITY_DN9082_c2_g2~~TRINITY_DN9082_c2_g2_i1.p1  ORF type:complete len:106 (-),score=9.38 TRINITY_DN9082_c2_g2_i1:1728-2045(-)